LQHRIVDCNQHYAGLSAAFNSAIRPITVVAILTTAHQIESRLALRDYLARNSAICGKTDACCHHNQIPRDWHPDCK